MTYVKGCDMRGFLTFQVLWLLSKENLHGEQIAERIKQRRGEKPKAGTLYPCLKDLNENGLIKGKKTGKIITYSLTPEGKQAVKQAKTYFVRCFGEIIAEE